MKTIFKEGQKVFDKVFRKGKKGIIRLISKNKFRNFILVDFEDSIPALYTFDGILFDIDGEFIDARPTLSVFETKYLREEDFNKIPTIKDAIKYLERKNDLYIVNLNDTCDFEEVYTSKEMYDAFEALKSLILLRDYYNEGWQPDWKDSSIKYCIEIYLREIGIRKSCRLISKPFSFKSIEIAEKFLKEQKKLLEIAKPLL